MHGLHVTLSFSSYNWIIIYLYCNQSSQFNEAQLCPISCNILDYTYDWHGIYENKFACDSNGPAVTVLGLTYSPACCTNFEVGLLKLDQWRCFSHDLYSPVASFKILVALEQTEVHDGVLENYAKFIYKLKSQPLIMTWPVSLVSSLKTRASYRPWRLQGTMSREERDISSVVSKGSEF